MRAVVVCESHYGNTADVAATVAAGLGDVGYETREYAVEDVPDDAAAKVDLLVVGGPTHGHGMSRPSTRQSAGPNAASTGVREWLEGLPSGGRRHAAAFDTRFDKPRWLTGSAAAGIARRLVRSGYVLVDPPESFFVRQTDGPLLEGEEERARRWGRDVGGLARPMTTSDTAEGMR